MSQWSSFPWCSAPFLAATDELSGRYPVGFTSAQMLAARDWNTLHFTILANRGIADISIEIIQAMAYLNLGTIMAFDIAIDPIVATAAGRVGISGTMTRRMDSSQCVSERFIYNRNLCYVELNFSDVKRRQFGSVTFYYPRLSLIYYGDKCLWASELGFLQDSGEIGVSALSLTGASIETPVYYSSPVTQDANLTLEIEPVEVIDSLDFTPKTGPAGTTVTLSGITFAPMTEAWFGDVAAPSLLQAADNQSVMITSPAGARRDYITLRGGDYRYETRLPFIPS